MSEHATPSKLACGDGGDGIAPLYDTHTLEDCLHGLTGGSRPRAVVLILDLCRQLGVEEEVCRQLANGVDTGHSKGPLEAIINGALSSLRAQDQDYQENVSDPPPPYGPQRELQADYWKPAIEPALIRYDTMWNKAYWANHLNTTCGMDSP